LLILKTLCLPPFVYLEIIQHTAQGEIHLLEKKLHNKAYKPDTKDIEECLLVAIQNGHDYCIPSLVVAGARRLDCALYLAIQLERVKAIAILLLCKATITGDCAIIKSLLSEPPESENAPWYMVKVHNILSQGPGVIKMSYPIAVSIIERNYEATKELLLRTDLDMSRKVVDWSKLKLTLLHPSWVYSIAPWVVNLKLVNNHLRKLPSELFSATQLRRLNLSQNLLDTVPGEIFALPNLDYLCLAQNRIKDLPETEVWSQSLLSLDVAENLLTTLPQGIQNSCIEILNLSKNSFTAIPKCVCRITTLTSLDISSTPITSLPSEMQHLDHLVNLNASNVHISDLPGGGRVLRGYVKGIFKAHARISKVSPHVKLMLLCNSDRVKSAVLSRLKPHFSHLEQLPEFERFQWAYRPFFTRTKLYFNTWLLGSTYEYHSIYPCFFTSGALYVLVWDTTVADIREEIKVYLDGLIQHAPGANIFIITVIPEGYESLLETNFETFAKRLSTFFSSSTYSSLNYHGFMMLTAKQTAKDQSEVKQQIYDIASNMVVNGQVKVNRQYPATYLEMIPVLKKEQTMFAQRRKPGVLEEASIWEVFDNAFSSDLLHRMELPVMIDFLQEAGFILHYEDPNDRLDQYYFTRPVWLYNTLLRVVRHALQHPSKIEVSYHDLCSVANVNWSVEVGAALIRLMVRYAIVLPTHNNLYLITCLLPHSKLPPSKLNCGYLRRQFAPKSRGLPPDIWIRVIARVLTNLNRITDMSNRNFRTSSSKKEKDPNEDVSTDEETNDLGAQKRQAPAYDRCISTPPMARANTVAATMGSSMVEDSPVSSDNAVVEESEDTQLSHDKTMSPPSSLTVIQLTNKKHIEESDDCLTPMYDGAAKHPGLVASPEGGVKGEAAQENRNPEAGTFRNLDTGGLVPKEEEAGSENDKACKLGSREVKLNDLSKESSPRKSVSPPPIVSKNSDFFDITEDDKELRRNAIAKTFQGRHQQSSSRKYGRPLQKDRREELVESTPVTGSGTSIKQGSKAKLSRISSVPTRRNIRTSTLSDPVTLENGVMLWDRGILYNRRGVRFSIYQCSCDISAVGEWGLEICSNLTKKGRIVFSRLCRLVQLVLQERYPDLFSPELVLHKHELTQVSICPICLESKERNPTSFLIEACVHALLEKTEHNCRYHPKAIPLSDLIPDYLMVDFSSKLLVPGSSLVYDKTVPLHQGKHTSLFDGNFNDNVVAIKAYQQVDGKSITFPLFHIRQELEMLTSLDHPNIVKVFGYSLQPPSVLLEKAPMGNLYQKLMDTDQKISRSVRFHIACQISSALDYLHHNEVVYRTLKASSILVWSLDFKDAVNVKLANFERALVKSPSGLLGKTSFASYPAPEMLRYSFKEEYTEKVDIYSFGILLYELVTRWQPFGGIYNTDRIPMSQRPKLSSVNTTDYSSLVSLMETCWQEDPSLRPSASSLVHRLSLPAFHCHIATQVLRDCTSVRNCCFVPSMRQVWVYGEYSHLGEGESVEGTQVYILNSDNLTIQGTLEFKERASAVFTVDSKVWIGMTEACVHAYDTATFRFTDRFKLGDSATVIADNDTYIFVAQANGHLNCYPKLAQRESKVIDLEIGPKAIIAMITVNDIISDNRPDLPPCAVQGRRSGVERDQRQSDYHQLGCAHGKEEAREGPVREPQLDLLRTEL